MKAYAWAIIAVLALLGGTSCPQAKPQAPAAGSGATSEAAQVNAAQATEIPLPPAPPPPKGAQVVTITTSDNYKVAGWYWPPQGKGPNGSDVPAVLLLHMRGKDKSSWGSLPGMLLDEGYAVLAIDLRGHGQTLDPQGRAIALGDLRDSDYQAMLNDVAAAHSFLDTQKGVDSDRLGIIGASIGANLGLLYAGDDRRVRTVVALSPGLDYKSLKPLAALPGLDRRPLFLICSKGDQNSYDACTALKQGAVQEAPVSLRAYDGSAHGSDLLRDVDGLDETVCSGWMLNYLPPAAPPVT